MPDMGDFNNGGALVALNCIPYGDVYKPFSDLSDVTQTLPSKCLGSFCYRDADSNVTIFAGTATGLYMLDSGAWTEVTRGVAAMSIVPYTTGADGFWDIINYGTLVIATNYNDDIQVYDMAADTEFSQLSSTAPRCRRFNIVNNFLMCVDTVDGDGAVGYRVRWSPLANPKGDWSDDINTQADHEDIAGGDYSNSFVAQLEAFAVVVQGRALWRIDYVGGDTIFNFTLIYDGRGSLLPRSCLSNGNSIFFLGEDGYYQYDGTGLIAIGNKKIDKYFYSIFDETNDFSMNAQIDPLRKLAIWAFPSNATGGTGVCDMMAIFNWTDMRWSFIQQTSDCLFNYISTGFNMDNMDSVFPNVDLMPFSLDSRVLTGGKTALGAFNSDHALALFTGNVKTATLQTTEIRPSSAGRTLLASIIPYIEGVGATIQARLGSRNFLNDDVVWTEFVSQNPYTGNIDFEVDAAFHRVEVQVSGTWTTANSVGVNGKPTGVA